MAFIHLDLSASDREGSLRKLRSSLDRGELGKLTISLSQTAQVRARGNKGDRPEHQTGWSGELPQPPLTGPVRTSRSYPRIRGTFRHRRPLLAIAILLACAILLAENNNTAEPAYDAHDDTPKTLIDPKSVTSKDPSEPAWRQVAPSQQISCNVDGTSCLDPVGVVGEWVHVPDRTFAAPVCCRWVSAEFRKKKPKVCGTEQANAQFYSGFPLYPQQMFGNACKCEENNFTDEYEWRSPHLPKTFNPVDTCRLLGDRTALFVGDSTIHASGQALRRFQQGEAWKDWVNEVMPDITVVAVGAHVKTDDASYLGLVDEVLSGMIEMQSRHPRMKFAWKTQQPGGCTNEILSPKDAAAAARTIEYTRDKFNWHVLFDIPPLSAMLFLIFLVSTTFQGQVLPQRLAPAGTLEQSENPVSGYEDAVQQIGRTHKQCERKPTWRLSPLVFPGTFGRNWEIISSSIIEREVVMILLGVKNAKSLNL
ncbi:hypothetical protein THAOC_33056, partial [Thalassiosira oceanica]